MLETLLEIKLLLHKRSDIFVIYKYLCKILLE